VVLTPVGYCPRIIDRKLEEALKTFGAILLEGPRWCGKTWTMLNHANSVAYLMQQGTRILAENETTAVLAGDQPRAIDEWQEVPEIWDAIRFAVDQKPQRGQYLLTGSVTRQKTKEKVRHSGIGRIARMKLRTLSLYESKESTGAFSLSALMAGEKGQAAQSEVLLSDLIEITCRGGWPITLSGEVKHPLELAYDYLAGLLDDNLEEQSPAIREPQKFRYFLASLARNSAAIVKNSTLHDDVRTAAGEFSSKTLAAYLQILRDFFLLEELPGWNPAIRSKARVLSSPKRFLVDPSLAVAALGTSPEKLQQELQTYGGLFENLCLRDLLIYADAHDARVSYYRDNSGLEVDAIVESRDGRWAGFEVKLSARGIDAGARSLLRLKEKIRRGGGAAPVCMVILTGSEVAYQREDGVWVIPITLLRD